jgi:tyrosine-protein kinase Etk/Wzc
MSEDKFFKEKPNSNILVQVVQRYLPFWPVFIMLGAVSLSVAYIYLRAQTKIYVAAAKVLLKDPQKGGGDSKVLDALNIFSEKKIVENEIIVLRSTILIQQVVKELDLYTSIFNEGKVQTEEIYAGNSPVKFIALEKDSIAGAGKYKFSIDWNKRVVKIDNRNIPFNGILTLGKTSYVVKINEEYNPNVVGKNFFAIPFLGKMVAFVKTVPGFILLIALPGLIFIFSEAREMKMEWEKEIEKKIRREINKFEAI